MKTKQKWSKVRYYLLSLLFMGTVSLVSAAEIKTIEFSELRIGDGKPVSLKLDDKEMLTGETFRDLIAEDTTPYAIAVIRSKGPSGDEYHFFDAGELEEATAKKMVDPSTKHPITQEDILEYEITDLAKPPQKISEETPDLGSKQNT